MKGSECMSIGLRVVLILLFAMISSFVLGFRYGVDFNKWESNK